MGCLALHRLHQHQNQDPEELWCFGLVDLEEIEFWLEKVLEWNYGSNLVAGCWNQGILYWWW